MNTLHQQPITNSPSVSMFKGRILIVDDEPVLRAMASSMLTIHGWEVLSASSAEEAAQLMKYCTARQSKVAVVIMDLIMPGGMSGVDAVETLRAIQPDSKLIASSGFLLGASSCERCKEMGFDDVLPKPYSVQQLAEVVDRNTV